MKCPSEVELNEFAEDRLATQRRWEVEQHLQDCPGCRTDLEGLAWATEALDQLLADVLDEAALDETAHPAPEDLAALRDGKLQPLQRAEVLRHLSVCAECARLYGQLPQEKRELPLVRHWQPFAAAAAFLLIIGFIFFVARDQFTTGRAPLNAIERKAVKPTSANPPAGDVAPQAIAPEQAERVTPPAAAKATPQKPAVSAKTTTPGLSTRGKTAVVIKSPSGVGKATGPAQANVLPPPAPKPVHMATTSITPPATSRHDEVTGPSRPKGPAGPRGFGDRMGMLSVPTPQASGGRSAEVQIPGVVKATGRVPAEGTATTAGGSKGAARPNALTPQQMLSQKAKNWPIGQQAMAPGMPGAAGVAPAPATTPAAAVAGAPGGKKPTVSVTLANRVLSDRRWLQSLRNDPARKARIKAILERELQREKSGRRHDVIVAALRVLNAPVAHSVKPAAAKHVVAKPAASKKGPAAPTAAKAPPATAKATPTRGKAPVVQPAPKPAAPDAPQPTVVSRPVRLFRSMVRALFARASHTLWI